MQNLAGFPFWEIKKTSFSLSCALKNSHDIMRIIKFFFGFIFLLLISQESNAQDQMGFKFGLHFATFSGIDSTAQVGDLKPNIGLHGGVYYQAAINEHISIVPGLHFYQKGLKLTGEDDSPGFLFAFNSKLIVDYLEAPILFRYSFNSDPQEVNFYLSGGPTFSYALSARNIAVIKANGERDRTKEDIDFDELGFRRFDIGANFNAGVSIPVDVGSIILEIHYSLGISNINDDSVTDMVNRNRGYGISFGYQGSLTEED